ncbi:2-polyprenyl-6-methoxyphenol hydroxylase [Micromonospora matsumotoense]|uniref:2-polyprenyl-6-methoxyphenol hydroxylase n=1 Tax=Micromonospora matsumotoense TaxID=121616 RepID=A0A1C5A2S7_9ACTN|nr:FAD-dependent oxidoreductase [Micromonospora matsumotoense]SCF39446.1 2-polyprenyl-6-methoxyphenol hydroxylase [Micromonospora matsumotoense]
MSPSSYDVLVVGAGPVGLTAAHELARRGVAVRVVDRASGPATTSRATATHARTLETYYQMGLVDEFLRRGQRVEHFTMHQRGRRLIRLDTDYSSVPTRFPFTLQVDQVITEEILRNALHDLGVVVEWGVGLTELDQTDDMVTATLEHVGGGTEHVKVGWLVGADGGHSLVRQRLGFELLGESSETWLIADAVLDADLPRDSLHWMHTGNGTIMLVPFPAPGKWRLLDTVDVGGAEDPDAVADRFARKITKALGIPVRVSTPTWVSVFTIQQRMIRQMRSGRCFVAGDAAHVHSPASGQGMNTGIQDAYNLGWKLAEVVRGHADDALLDSYPAERVPVGATLLGTTKTATALVALRNAAAPVTLPIGLGLLNLATPLKRRVERKIMEGMSGLALHYCASPLSQPVSAADGIEPGYRVACSVETESVSVGWREMCAELTDPRWTLLATATATVESDRLAAVLADVERDFGRSVSVRTVVDTVDTGTYPRPLGDPGGTLRRQLGLGTGEYALIRPDGYLAGKGRIAGSDELTARLRRFTLVPHEPTPTR